MERTIENILKSEHTYVDSCSWKFYEGGQTTEQVRHTAYLTITKLPEDKVAVVMVTFKTGMESITLRLAPHEFDQLNSLFKRASFRLEKI